MDYTGLYGKKVNTAEVDRRFAELEKKHKELFGVLPEAIFSTSGRTELGGNHTDHNLGKVIAGSINLDTIAAASPSEDMTVTFMSEGFDPITVDLENLGIEPEEKGTTASLIRGVAHCISENGGIVQGFRANVSSTVFQGSGLSSSAAVEVLIGTIFNSLFNNDRFTTTELAIYSQKAENVYFGKPSGLMDQVACANGGIVEIDFRDPSKPEITPIAVDFSDYGYDLVITATGGSHADLTDDYASIPYDMKQVAAFFGKSHLREVEPDLFMDSISKLRGSLSNDRAILRALHYFEENNRVDAMVKALRNKDFESYLELVTESGNSSFRYLQNIFSPVHPFEQGISIALALTEKYLQGSGAFRVQGGGFAGTIQAYVPCERTVEYKRYMEQVFGKGCCTALAIRNLPTMRVK